MQFNIISIIFALLPFMEIMILNNLIIIIKFL